MNNQSPLEQLAEFTKKRTEHELTKALLKAVISSSAMLDKVASWLLAGIGGTAALLISNLDKTANILDVKSIKAVLLLLIVGGLFGLLQKHIAMQVQIRLTVESEIEASFGAVLKKHDEQEEKISELRAGKDQLPDISVDFANVFREVETVIPWYQKRIFKRGIQTGKSDQLAGPKSMARLYNRQVLYAGLEFILVVSAICVVAFSI